MNLRSPVAQSRLVFAALAIFYLALGLFVLSADAVYSGDIGVKFVQARALAAHGFTSLDLPYPGAFLDPERVFFPMRPPFVITAGGETQAIFPPASAVVQAVGGDRRRRAGHDRGDDPGRAGDLVGDGAHVAAGSQAVHAAGARPRQSAVVLRRQRLGARPGGGVRRGGVRPGDARIAARARRCWPELCSASASRSATR